MTAVMPPPPSLQARWQAAWPSALAAWSRYTKLRAPLLCITTRDAKREGLVGSFAMIRLADQSVVVDLQSVEKLGLSDHAAEILAHEIGHHVYAPANGTDHFRLLARIRRALPTLEVHAAMVGNLYTDLHINDRLQRQSGLRMAEVYQLLHKADAAGEKPGRLWTLYLRIYENLWQLKTGSLGGTSEADEGLDTDAWLGARVVRVYANDWLAGAGRFAALLLPYLVEDEEARKAMAQWHDTQSAAAGCSPQGAQEIEDDEGDGSMHPASDSRITGAEDNAERQTAPPVARGAGRTSNTGGQFREPFEYGEILRATGIELSDHDIAVRYYRERALPHRVPYPKRPAPESVEPQPEGLEPWDIGDAIDELDAFQSVLLSPKMIPGLSTVRRVYGLAPGIARDPVPLDLDIYIDSSGSMPDPQRQMSWLTLAGAIIVLSALRAGARVQATLWSGPTQETHTDGFVRDEDALLRVLTGFYGGSTAFPIHRMRDTYANRGAGERPVHILMISDDGITTMFDRDERGNSGWQISAHAMNVARGGGTMILNLPAAPDADLQRAQREHGWVIETIRDWQELLGFARRFSRRHYADVETRRAA